MKNPKRSPGCVCQLTLLFTHQDFVDLKSYIKNNYRKDLVEIDLCVKGWNWGELTFRGSLMAFNVDGKPAFEVPLNDVSQVFDCRVVQWTGTIIIGNGRRADF